MTFKSIDTTVDENKAVHFPTEFLNSLDVSGMPPQSLWLEIRSLVIFLYNLNPPRFCNDTCLFIKRTTRKILEAIILTAKCKGEIVLLPRVPLISPESPIPFKNLQFPIRLVFAMTINKSQTQTMFI
ncbi:ATP-dependent DNA helicase [Trichonephila clavipes]|uniref:ATP-dependent DNA helicase n=1 Tax=Trichonephila clavipes TaxID=2585209 RepID=A0A8X6SR05_TRICX|nr:ATP-dependent DNA helicase [Trichonephila clavipes]